VTEGSLAGSSHRGMISAPDLISQLRFSLIVINLRWFDPVHRNQGQTHIPHLCQQSK
jgi:hypothetical protein